VRLRITRALSGSIDGIHLSHFVVGEVYDVGTSLGSFLLSVGAATPEPDAMREENGAHPPSASPGSRATAADVWRKRRPRNG
jgi:hypothetical protein